MPPSRAAYGDRSWICPEAGLFDAKGAQENWRNPVLWSNTLNDGDVGGDGGFAGRSVRRGKCKAPDELDGLCKVHAPTLPHPQIADKLRGFDPFLLGASQDDLHR